MRTKPTKDLIVLGFVLVSGFACVFLLSSYLESNRVVIPESYADSDLALQGKRLKGFTMGFEGLLADWYWMWSLQYIGGKISNSGLDNLNLDDMRALNPRLLYPLLDNATDLDPKLLAAYSYGATVLPAIDPKQAIDLTNKGIERNPEHWRLLQHLGYIHWKLKEFDKAAEAYDRGSRINGAPRFFKLMAAKMRSESGGRETARVIYSEMMAEAPDQQTRSVAEFRLTELQALDELDLLNVALSSYRAKYGRCVNEWAELFPILLGITTNVDFQVDEDRSVLDPTGIPYQIDRQTCKGKVGHVSRLLKS